MATISEIIDIIGSDNSNNSGADQRRELTDEDIPVIARLLLGEEKQARACASTPQRLRSVSHQ